jgi:hypothetical protein
LQHHSVVDQRGEIVRAGITEIHRERVVAVLVAHTAQAFVDDRERFVPRHRAERAVVVAHERLAHAIRISFEMLERGPLRAEVAVAEDVVFVAAHERDGAAVEMQLEPARRFAEMARAVLNARLRRRHAGRLRPPAAPCRLPRR